MFLVTHHVSTYAAAFVNAPLVLYMSRNRALFSHWANAPLVLIPRKGGRGEDQSMEWGKVDFTHLRTSIHGKGGERGGLYVYRRGPGDYSTTQCQRFFPLHPP